MLVDINVKGKTIFILGGGREATRKIELLQSQECKLYVFTDHASEKIQQLAEQKILTLKIQKIDPKIFIGEIKPYLVMLMTDDRELNREMAESARKLDCLVYIVDDPTKSDFNHPSTMTFHNTIQVALSTGGKSPLMAKIIRQKIQPILNELIQYEDAILIELLGNIREQVKQSIPNQKSRQQFFDSIRNNPQIIKLISQKQLTQAESLALSILKEF